MNHFSKIVNTETNKELKISVSLPLFIIYIYIYINVNISLGIYSNLLKISPNLFDNTISTLRAYVSKKQPS